MAEIQRTEYPRPQFVRQSWLNLNGTWEFAFDDNKVGRKKKWHHGNTPLPLAIQVPFTFESELSGIDDPEIHDNVWYRRSFSVPDTWKGKDVLLHFGAVDYVAHVWVNGELVATHEGGHTPFYADITHEIRSEGDNVIVVQAEDFSKNLSLPRGKQYWETKSKGIFYTRTTGIWQTVWMEAVESTYLEKVNMTPNIDRGELELTSFVHGHNKDDDIRLKVNISFKDQFICEDMYSLKEQEEKRTILLPHFNGFRRCMLWSPDEPNLYDISFTLIKNGKTVDEISSYFGMRKISVENGKVMLNNKNYFMRLVLDQGYFPDGNLTPPSDEAIKQDIVLTKEMGFNGARKHQKIEDPRYHYWCDKLGLLVWGEAANAYQYSQEYVRRFTKEWQESIARDINHPCIVAWVPLNESWGVWNIKENTCQQQHALAMYHLTRSIDPTRLVVSNDGWEHLRTDLCTVHDYEPSKAILEERYSTVNSALNGIRNHHRSTFVGGIQYEGQPILVSEFGGISFKKSQWEGWGYSGAENEKDFLEKLQNVIDPMLSSPVVQGFCYTQLTDVEQEINGLLTYDRVPKASLEEIRKMVSGRCAEKKGFTC